VPTTVMLELPAGDDLPDFSRADITFYGVDHSGASYEARVFLDRTDADESTPLTDPAYAGSFGVFGHGGCFGEEGHCQVRGPVSTFDRRLPHQLVPATRVLICTAAVKRLIGEGRTEVSVTVVAVVRPSALTGAEVTGDDVLHFDQVALHTYE
jgi:hypothetical protein